MAYTFEQLLAADPSNPANIAQNAAIAIFEPGDATMAPLTITDPDGSPLPNPFPVNANGFGPAFAHETLDRVAWSGGGFTGFVTSYEGMKAEAVAAREAAETAATTAGAEAAAVAASALAGAVAEAEAAATEAATSAQAAANSAALVGAPADTAIAAAIHGTGTATKTALDASYATPQFVRPKPVRRQPQLTVNTTFQTGHGYAANTGTWTADTVDCGLGSQSVKTTVTSALAATYRKLAQPAVDLSARDFAVLLKVDNPVELDQVQLYLGISNLASFEPLIFAKGASAPTAPSNRTSGPGCTSPGPMRATQ